MRNLISFLIRFNAFFIFLLLETVALIFVFRSHTYHRTGFLNSAGHITGNVFETYFQFGEYLNLKEVNLQLMEENARLRERTDMMYTADFNSTIEVCNDTGILMYEYIPVKVINNSTDRISNYLTLNKGSRDGIRKDMGVITSSGVVGIINRVSADFSTAMSILHKDSRISIKIKRFNYPGTMFWNGGNPSVAELSGIPQHLPLAVGDSIITSGFSAIFPENLPVGIISEIESTKGSSFYEIKVLLSANLQTLQYAYVVNNLFYEQQQQLEKLND